MHMRDRGSAQVMRRASTGPHALMQRQAIAPYVPDRGLGFYMPARSARGFSGSTTQSAAKGASVGASVGSVVPVIGTAVGAILGGIGGAIASAFSRQDQEVQNFDQAQAISHAQGPAGVLNIENKYLALAGLFDLQPSQIKGNIPIYKKYGRMGEQRFVADMVNQIYSAAQAGQITTNDTPQTIFNRIVLPWINSFGYGSMSDSNADMINMLLLGMVAEYIGGYQTRWYARGGDNPFGGLPPFSLPGAVSPTSSATPSPTAVPAQQSELARYMNGAQPESGTQVNYARDANGQFMAIPAGGVLVGRAPTGAWIIQYATGQYVLSGSQLIPYSTSSATVSAPVTVPAQTLPDVMSPATGSPYYAPPSSSGANYSFPQYAPAQPTETAGVLGGVSVQTLLLGGAAIFALSLLLPHNINSVRSARR